MAIDITYIVPVYNALPDLERTASSLLGQRYDARALELIFVDDGSTDGSGAYLDGLAREHASVRVFHTGPSGGPAAPRNVGLSHARGAYVFFCDADDWMEPDASARMMGHVREWDPDVMLVKPKGEFGRHIAAGAFDETLPRADVYRSGVGQALGPCKLFRRAFLEEHRLMFATGLPVWEDQPFVLAAYLLARRVSVAADGVYCHWAGHGEEDGSSNARAHVSSGDVMRHLSAMLSLLDAHANRDAARKVIAQRVLREALFYAARALAREGGGDRLQAERLHHLASPYFSDAFYGMCNVQRSLMYRSFRARDFDAWIDICLREPSDPAFSAERFAVDDAARTVEASWEGASRHVVDARGRLPLGFSLESLSWGGDGTLHIEGRADERALYGCERAVVRLARRNRGTGVDVACTLGRTEAGRQALSASIPPEALLGDRAPCWDVSVVASYVGGRKRRQRVHVGDAGAVAGGALSTPAVIFDEGSGESASVVPYATPRGALSVMDYLLEAELSVSRRPFGAVVELEGVPDRAFKVLGAVEIAFGDGPRAHVASFESNGAKTVPFKAWKLPVRG